MKKKGRLTGSTSKYEKNKKKNWNLMGPTGNYVEQIEQ